ncbi:MAG: SPOR domain-containing protein [Deltaproteobacteria bacterium]|nr:SPOR domain-containing protein [Deltaproteobacteria bacterium]
MNSRGKKWWIVLGGVPLFLLILILSSVDLSTRLHPVREGGTPQIRVSASAVAREPVVPPVILSRRDAPLPAPETLDPSMVEGYRDPEDRALEEKSEAAPLSYPFSVLIASFRNPDNAKQVMTSCREKGYLVYGAKTDLKGRGTWVRVFAGCFTDLEGALDFIRSEGLENAVPVKTRYANLIGCFRSRAAVRDRIQQLSVSGYTPYFIEDDNGTCRLYAGAFETREGAEKQAAALAAAGFSCLPVKR